jgi:hypothetical protein
LFNYCKSLPIILTTFIVVLLVFNSTLAGISTIFFQNDFGDIYQNNLKIMYALASPEEEAGDSNNDDASEDSQGLPEEEAGDSNNDDASEDSQGLPDVVENITTVNPSLTTLSEPLQNEECPAGSPEGCYVKPYSLSARQSCQPGEMELKNTPDGPKGMMCAPIQPPQNQENPTAPIGGNETLPENSILTINEFNPEVTVTKSSPVSCNSQGTLFDPTTDMCKNPQSIQDCAKIMQRYDPNLGKCTDGFIP